jgi:penicillin-binding protein 1A
MANRQERHQRRKETKAPRVRKKSPRGKLAKSTKISLSILAVMLLMVVAGTIFFFQKYGKEVTAAIDAGEEHAASIQESDFKQYHPTTVLDKNGQVIKELKTQERDYLTYDKMDPLVSQALIAIEDKRFYEHHGVDTQGLLTIAINAATGRGIRGASTITQQLVKNIYLTPEVSISRKIEEMVMAQSLEKKFTKHQILEYYLNNVYFGHGAYGINAAAKVYFGKSINDTSLLEKAVLVGITNNPGIFDPTDNKKNALKRAKLILKEMNQQGYITKDQYDKAVTDDFEAKIHSNALNNQLDNNEVALAVDSATKILMGQQDFRFQYQFDSKEEEDRYNEEYSSAYNKVYQRILSGGYQISTNIDTGLHDQLQGIVSNVMNAWQDRSGDNNFYTKQAAMLLLVSVAAVRKEIIIIVPFFPIVSLARRSNP